MLPASMLKHSSAPSGLMFASLHKMRSSRDRVELPQVHHSRKDRMNIHKNARLTPRGRERIVRQVASGQTPEAVAEAVGVCPRTVRKWVDPYRCEGLAGLQDRSSRPLRLRRPTASRRWSRRSAGRTVPALRTRASGRAHPSRHKWGIIRRKLIYNQIFKLPFALYSRILLLAPRHAPPSLVRCGLLSK